MGVGVGISLRGTRNRGRLMRVPRISLAFGFGLLLIVLSFFCFFFEEKPFFRGLGLGGTETPWEIFNSS